MPSPYRRYGVWIFFCVVVYVIFNSLPGRSSTSIPSRIDRQRGGGGGGGERDGGDKRGTADSQKPVLRPPPPSPKLDVVEEKKSTEVDLKKAKIGMLTMTTSQQTYNFIIQKNRWSYAKKHGYDSRIDYEEDKTINQMGAVWHKVTMIQDAIATKKYDWLHWLDFDALITNRTIPVTGIIAQSLAEAKEAGRDPDKVDFIVNADCFPLNAGSMMIRAHPRVLKFWERVWQCGLDTRKEHDAWDRAKRNDPDAEEKLKAEGKEPPRPFSEQDCIQKFLKENKQGEKETTWYVPQYRINAFPEEIGCFDQLGKRGWKRGDFALHFAGAWAHIKEDDPYGFLIRKYERFVI